MDRDNTVKDSLISSQGMGRAYSCIIVLVGVIAALLLIWVILAPMWDPDLWWHLKTGDTILEQGRLFSEDIFAYTSDLFSTARESAILKGYPASQICYSLLHDLFGFKGLLGLRILLLIVMSIIAIRSGLKRGASVLALSVVLALAWACVYWAHTFDRPHIFSFLFFLLLIASLRPVGKESWWVVPMMAVWANFHGGFIAGDLALVAYLGGRFLDVGFGGEFKRSLVWAGACITMSFANPSGAYFFTEMFSRSVAGSFVSGIIEYQSTLEVFGSGRPWVVLIWITVLLVGMARLFRKDRVWSEIFLLILFAALATIYVRMTAFFMIGLAPVVATDFSDLLRKCRNFAGPAVGAGLLVLLAIPTYYNGSDVLTDRGAFWPEQNPFYPVASAEYLQSSDLQGRMFNYYGWGGYLIWKLYPQYQVFIDGRAFSDELYADYRAIGSANQKDPTRHYEKLLDQYRVEFVLIPLQNRNGTLVPLFSRLFRNPRWSAVYVDQRAVVFVRENGVNEDYLERNRIAADQLFALVVAGFQSRIAADRMDLAAWQGAAQFYLAAQRMQEAREMITRGLQIAPDHPGLLWLKPYAFGQAGR